MKYRYFI